MDMAAPYISWASRRGAVAAVVLGALAVGAWLASVDAMNGMEMGRRFSVGSLGFFVVLWVLMMAAMMFPSVWPAVVVHGLVVRRRASASAHSLARLHLSLDTLVRGLCSGWGRLLCWRLRGRPGSTRSPLRSLRAMWSRRSRSRERCTR